MQAIRSETRELRSNARRDRAAGGERTVEDWIVVGHAGK